MHKIVILDGHCLNSGDLSWDAITSQAEFKLYPRSNSSNMVTRAYDADIIITNKCSFDKKMIDSLPNLRYIGVLATGYNTIDVDYCKQKGIIVTNIPSYSTESVVQTIFGLITELYNGIGYHNDTVKDNKWTSCVDFCYYRPNMHELCNKTIGIIGYGSIGKRVAEIARAYRMNVLIYNKGRAIETQEGINFCLELEDVIKQSDIVSLNCPLNENNKGMINKTTLSYFKPTAVLINTARGGLIVEQDLADALNNGVIKGAGLDVLSTEPPLITNPLLKAINTVITPHIAWATIEARSRLMSIAADNLYNYLQGKPTNVISK